METAAESTFTLERLNVAVEQKAWNGVFPADLEHFYSAYLLKRNKRDFGHNFWPAVLTYNAFLLVDYLVVPEVANVSAFLHFCVVTPALIVLNRIYTKAKSLRAQEVGWSINTCLVLFQIVFIFWIAQSEARAHYQALVLLVVIFYNIERPVSFRIARWVNVLFLVGYSGAMLTSHAPMDVMLIGILMLLVTIYTTIRANWRLERDSRFSFLRLLQDEARLRLSRQDAFIDPLTGLHNRRYLNAFISEELDADTVMGVIIADIDHFKLYNDSYGHQAGDKCLCRVAATFSLQVALKVAGQITGTPGTVIRYGGEEFLVLLPGADLAMTQAVAERLRLAVEALGMEAPGNGVKSIETRGIETGGVVTASFGVASGVSSAERFPDLLNEADIALYVAKKTGRNRVHMSLSEGGSGKE